MDLRTLPKLICLALFFYGIATQTAESKSRIERACPAEILEQERLAKEEVKNWSSSVSAPLFLVGYLRDIAAFRYSNCGYEKSKYRKLLWFATRVLKEKRKTGAFHSDTFQASAEVSLAQIWHNTFLEGLHGFARDKNQAQCWLKNSIDLTQSCVDLDRQTFKKIEQTKLPAGW